MKPSPNLATRRPRRMERRRLLIVTEGSNTEVQYIQGLLQHLRASGVGVRSASTKGIGRDPLAVFRAAERYTRGDPDAYDGVWLVVDVDSHARLADCIAQAAAKGYRTVVSNPCFEVWLLWHFEDCRSNHDSKWLSRRLEKHGHDGKNISPSFPFRDYTVAFERADRSGIRVQDGAVGANPSSSMPSLIQAITAS